MYPIVLASGWLLGAIPQFDAMTDRADHVIARLTTLSEADEIVLIRRRVREVDPLDEASVTELSEALAKRAAELVS